MSGSSVTPQQAGGLAVKEKYAPTAPCPHCGKVFPFLASWMSWIGHMGLHSTANRYFDGDISAAARQLAYNGLAAQERGAAWSNGAWQRKYKPIKPVSQSHPIPSQG